MASNPALTEETIRFGEGYELDLHLRRLRRGRDAIKLERIPLEILVLLVEHTGEIVTRDEIVARVWGKHVFLDTDNSIRGAIRKLRHALEDDAESPRFIQTVTGQGYRFIATIDTPAKSGPVGPSARAMRASTWRWLIPAAVVGTIAVVGWYLGRPLPMPSITAYTQLTRDGAKKSVSGTDGSRIYLFFGGSVANPVGEVSASGGQITHIPVAMRNIAFLIDVSGDGSNFLIISNEKGFINERPIWNVRLPEGSLRRLPSTASSARFSADGKMVAYATANGEIWVVGSDGSGARKLTSGSGAGVTPELPSGFAWSPDGRLIRFSRSGRLWEISTEGTNLHELLPRWPSAAQQRCGSWTPDGRFFVFLSTTKWYFAGGDIWALDERRGLLRRPHREPVRLTSGPITWGCPVPSRDGKQIFAEGWIARGELMRFDGGTGKWQPFLGGISAVGVAFSKDGQQVTYVQYNEGTLWKANQDGSHAVQLTYPPADVVMPRWSPDGTQISFTDYAASPINGYSVSASGGSPRISSPGNVVLDANWSSDGKKIVFSNSVADPRELHILDLESQRVTNLPGSAGVTSPRWSPDGRSIAGLSTDALSVKVFDLETEKWATFSQKDVVGYPQWTSDSRFLYFLRTNSVGNTGVYRLRVANGETEVFAGLNDMQMAGWFNLWMGLDSSDAPLLLKDIATHDVYALTLEEK